jgi:hypothetical protein
MPNRSQNSIERWGKRIGWDRRAKAVCKPCWEVKYCPYGPLVEQFPLRQGEHPWSCRIFGHDCPVFHVAEPFTETKELRRISREISRPTQFRVLKRDNQICGVCKRPMLDDDIHFDHIIPYAKGGSSDENNVRLLCGECNQKRSDRFEAEFLVRNAGDRTAEHYDLVFLDLLLDAFRFAHQFRRSHGVFPDAKSLGDTYNGGEVGNFEHCVADTFKDFEEFFDMRSPPEMTLTQAKALRKRWGFVDGAVRTLQDVASSSSQAIDTLVILERSLLSRAGWYLKEDKFTRLKWQKK